MSVVDRLTVMSDSELATLLSNALRLSAGDSARHQKAIDLLPMLESEISARKVRLAETRAATLPARSRARPARR